MEIVTLVQQVHSQKLNKLIEEFMEGKTILITGATGFLAKLVMEKILRVQSNVRKLYLLIRAPNNNSAKERFTREVMMSELFNVAREKIGSENLKSLMKEKVFAISGDISYENLGIKNSELREEMHKEIDIIINSAAVTNFYERYDIAMNVNVVGAMNVLKFAKSCIKLKMLLHVSTAYVCGKAIGILPEKPFDMGETLSENTYLDIDVERGVIANKLKELETLNATPKEVTIAMKELGMQRARLHGWPNIYSFTKAMGEMILGHLKENSQVVIIRPTIITSTYKEPFPGWIEGVRTVDSFIVAYGKGVLKFYYGDPDSKLDVIPGDMVVNSIVAAIIAHENQYSEDVVIYHISSSSRDGPLKNSDIMSSTFHYFTKNPWANKDGKTIKVETPLRPFSSIDSFRKHISIHYLPLLKMLKFVNIVSCHFFDKTYKNMERKMNTAIRLSQLYEPYVFFYGSFDDVNTEKLRLRMKEINMDEVLNFDPRCIKWEDYLMNIHIPGVVKYLF
ncbi:fatty acyl-CoA reductase 3-like [Solanum tuberosum]|uniref:fatty acyl-CoA reductase 3-like n=1 Tax=Solanum tuberosum TaxID=4113 RepID=UPI0003D28E5D|nr:PREDICTED: fatty acyl-CoA reductase 3-like [Solanum tuberosum]